MVTNSIVWVYSKRDAVEIVESVGIEFDFCENIRWMPSSNKAFCMAYGLHVRNLYL